MELLISIFENSSAKGSFRSNKINYEILQLSTDSRYLQSGPLKKRATRRSRRAREPSRIPLLFLRGLNKKNSMLKKFVFKKISTIEIPKSSRLHRYVNKVRKLYRARYKCNNKRDPKIINLRATVRKNRPKS